MSIAPTKSRDTSPDTEFFEFAVLPVEQRIVLLSMRVDKQGMRQLGDAAFEMSRFEAKELAQQIMKVLADSAV